MRSRRYSGLPGQGTIVDALAGEAWHDGPRCSERPSKRVAAVHDKPEESAASQGNRELAIVALRYQYRLDQKSDPLFKRVVLVRCGGVLRGPLIERF
jgi:hypothetical protein